MPGIFELLVIGFICLMPLVAAIVIVVVLVTKNKRNDE